MIAQLHFELSESLALHRASYSMWWQALCVAVLVLWLTIQTLAISNCTEKFQCFATEYSQCVNDSTATAQPVQGLAQHTFL